MENVKEITKGIVKRRKTMRKDVVKMCKLLKKLNDEICHKRKLEESFKAPLKKHFRDIYWSLKLHVMFHLGIPQTHMKEDHDLQLQEVGKLELVDLKDKDDIHPDQECAIDPGSKLLEILSAISDHPEGSKQAADAVMTIAKGLFQFLSSNNIFKPKVLAQVKRNDRWVVGSSIAVSHFLRPLCLYRRIDNFKQPLQKAVTSFQPIHSADIKQTKNWLSSAFSINVDKNDHENEKPPCENCQKIFKNLAGFIKTDSAHGGGETFLGACAEYCPVDQLLADDEKDVSENDKELIHSAMEKYNGDCSRYYESFATISKKFHEAEDDRGQKEVYEEFKDILTILKPEYYKQLKTIR